ncbi:MAG: hypothetical protein R3F60_10315 [bacterium]
MVSSLRPSAWTKTPCSFSPRNKAGLEQAKTSSAGWRDFIAAVPWPMTYRSRSRAFSSVVIWIAVLGTSAWPLRSWNLLIRLAISRLTHSSTMLLWTSVSTPMSQWRWLDMKK